MENNISYENLKTEEIDIELRNIVYKIESYKKLN